MSATREFNDEQLKIIGHKLKVIMNLRGETQENIGINVFKRDQKKAQSFVKTIVNGARKKFNKNELKMILDYLKVSIDEFNGLDFKNIVFDDISFIDNSEGVPLVYEEPDEEYKKNFEDDETPFEGSLSINNINSDYLNQRYEACFDRKKLNALLNMWCDANALDSYSLKIEIEKEIIAFIHDNRKQFFKYKILK